MRHQAIARCSRLQLLFWRRCGRCRVLQTAEGANKGDAWRLCKHCPEPGSKAGASSLEQVAWVMVKKAAGSQLWATESRLLGGTHGASDFILDLQGGPARQPAERRWAVVEVDGSRHFDKPRKDTGRAERRRIDREKDEAAWQQRRPVLRLHHADMQDWPDLLAAARHYSRQSQLVTFALYTTSYHQPSLGLWKCGSTTELSWWKVGGWVGWHGHLHGRGACAWGSSRWCRRSSRGPALPASSARHT